jgi:hypothetical protein
MLMGSNDADGQVGAEEFSAQWNDPKVANELAVLGFESPAQMGSLFMADAGLLGQVTANAAPVTDNFPSRISSNPVNHLGYIELYDKLMNETERLQRFRDSDLISRLWPAELVSESESYFEYERLIKNHFTANEYRHATDPYYWESIDNLLTDTSLTTLPLWLLGSDQANQQILADLLEVEGYRKEFALELARGFAANRDFNTALMYMGEYVATAGDVSAWSSNFYLYLLAKNDLTSEAAPIISKLETLEQPGIDRFLDWYSSHFDSGAAADPKALERLDQQVSESYYR